MLTTLLDNLTIKLVNYLKEKCTQFQAIIKKCQLHYDKISKRS